ncbi:hypothetical protein KHA90_18570 [Flavobacterium psychroterrae]|uniref:Uncharacterized protein n=1 Tax=Flavobacterium psychroterrae TaxID=2133767 RepID=A0ABS5PGG5_9FLAO|nr:hypothetical protein [Flavobacterium psychroterrae]MBS7233030.1 hypothetical protein [Flavobacterium psychroterrae]
MKNINIEEVWSSRLLYEKPYIVLSKKTGDDILEKLLAKNPLFKIPENAILYDVLGCYQDIPINHTYDFIFKRNNIDENNHTMAIIKNVYALGAKEIEVVPATWSVTALIEFPNGIPPLIKNKEEKDLLYLCSKKLWEELVKIIP